MALKRFWELESLRAFTTGAVFHLWILWSSFWFLVLGILNFFFYNIFIPLGNDYVWHFSSFFDFFCLECGNGRLRIWGFWRFSDLVLFISPSVSYRLPIPTLTTYLVTLSIWLLDSPCFCVYSVCACQVPCCFSTILCFHNFALSLSLIWLDLSTLPTCISLALPVPLLYRYLGTSTSRLYLRHLARAKITNPRTALYLLIYLYLLLSISGPRFLF